MASRIDNNRHREFRAREGMPTPSKEESLRTLSYRLNLLNGYMLKNVVCNVADIQPTTPRKYAGRHDNKSYLDMKKKGIRQEAIRERLDTQREIIKALEGKDAELVAHIVDSVERCIVAEGYRL